jgi:hypothetical protein
MTEPFVDAEVDRTKSRWVAKAYYEFGRSKTTLRALFYYALSRKEPDYPICGGFVGEIRCTRHYHECDGEKLPKWASKAKRLGFVPIDALLEETPGEHIFLPATQPESSGAVHIEVWLNRSAFNALLQPVCEKHGAILVSVSGQPSSDVVEGLFNRSRDRTTIILCLSDLSADSFSFCEDLSRTIDRAKGQSEWSIRVKHAGITPEKVLELKIPMVPGRKSTKENWKEYRNFLAPYGLSDKRMAELDALEVYYPGGIAEFVDKILSENESMPNPDEQIAHAERMKIQ